MHRVFGSVLALFLTIPAVLAAEGPPHRVTEEHSTDAAAEIRASLDGWLNAYESGDIEALVRLFTEDAIYVANTGDVMEGRAAIREGVGRFLARRGRFFEALGAGDEVTLDAESEWLRFRKTADAAHTLGRFRVMVRPLDCIMDTGPYLAVWRRGPEAEWRIDTLLVSQDRTPPDGACLPPPRPAAGDSDTGLTRAAPGETVRVVRFNVLPDGRAEFERFFSESLAPAVAKRQGVPLEDLDLGAFRLLLPTAPNRHGYYTYHVLVDPIGFELTSNQAMRDLVRSAFPGEEGERRVRRWMASMVLEAPFTPAAENFVEADLKDLPAAED